MTIKDLWLATTYVGRVQLEDETHLISNPLLVAEGGLTTIVFDSKGNYTEYANREVNYFDFMFNTMRIILKENK